jgi:hypothetical protein
VWNILAEINNESNISSDISERLRAHTRFEKKNEAQFLLKEMFAADNKHDY